MVTYLQEPGHTVSVPGCGVTKTRKILHHPRPHLFPLIDRQTMAKLGENLWLTIYDDLKEQASAFDELEAWFRHPRRHQGWRRADAPSPVRHPAVLPGGRPGGGSGEDKGASDALEVKASRRCT